MCLDRLYAQVQDGAHLLVAVTLGDQLNDVLMFKPSGLSIAMGNASPDVQSHATVVTTSFADEGFANAVERYVLP